MQFESRTLKIPQIVEIKTRRRGDNRGYFVETYRASVLEALGILATFVQDNQSMSAEPGTIRGLHFQRPPKAQAKLIRVLRGAIFDVAVDLRAGSPTYGRWSGARLTADGGEQLFVPAGFAHGYCTLEPSTEVAYKCDAYYDPELEAGLFFADPDLQIEWPVEVDAAVLSAKDRAWPAFRDFVSPFVDEKR